MHVGYRTFKLETLALIDQTGKALSKLENCNGILRKRKDVANDIFEQFGQDSFIRGRIAQTVLLYPQSRATQPCFTASRRLVDGATARAIG